MTLLAQTARAQNTAEVSVDAGRVLQTGAAGGARLGINIDYWWDDQANRVAGARSLSSALSTIGARYWRFPGGEKADGMLWSTPPFSSAKPRLARISSADWPSNDPAYWTPAGNPAGDWAHPVLDFDEFMTSCRAAGCTPVIVIAYDGIYKPANPGGVSLTRSQALAAAQAWVRYANLVKSYGVRYWEIGNETWNPGYMGSDPGRVTQGRDFVEFCAAMKQVDASIQCGISTQSRSDWETLLGEAAPSIDFLSVHSYQSYVFADYEGYRATALDQLTAVDDAAAALALFPAHRDRIAIAVTETGGITFGVNGTWTQGDLGHALMTFDTLAQFQQDSRVTFTQLWNTRWIEQNRAGNIWPGYPSAEYDALKPDNSPTPQGMAFQLLARNSLANMVATTSTASVRTFASRDPATGRMTIWLLNKNTASTRATVTLQNHPGTGTGAVTALHGVGWWDTAPRLDARASVAITGGRFALDLDPVSITMIRL